MLRPESNSCACAPLTALELLSATVQALFVCLFAIVVINAVRRPSRATFDTALLFGSIAVAVVAGRVVGLLGATGDPIATALILAVFGAAPYAMIRLVDDFMGAPRFLLPASLAVYLVIAALGFVLTERPQVVEILLIPWFVGVGGYSAYAFNQAANRSRGITRRRMRAVVLGAVLFIAAVVLVLARVVTSSEGLAVDVLAQLAGLASVLSFFVGFAPPSWIRQAWREPDLRLFLESSVHLVGVADEATVIGELQRAAAIAAGADGASVGIADQARSVIRYFSRDDQVLEYPDDAFIAGRAYLEQRRIVARDALSIDPQNAERYESSRARSVIAAPITRGDRRIGALAIYADRAPIFVEDDVWLIELLADQVGMLLEAQSLTRQAGAIEAREEAARLKEEFLSAAAHDLRTPLTVVLGQAELLERRVARDPAARADPAGVARLAKEARRLRDLIGEILDAQRMEDGAVSMSRSVEDVASLVESVRERHADNGARVLTHPTDLPVMARVDAGRIHQVIENLLENALKYSAGGTPPELRVWADGAQACIAVIDHGVGVPEKERDRIFDRFYRASNAQGITDTGMGLGLYICRRIVDEHDGRIWLEETPGGGSTFMVSLPLEQPAPATIAPPTDEPRWAAQAGGEAVADA